MPRISTLKDDDKLLCFGSRNADASDGILYSAAADFRVELSDEQRVLIIGVGGQGIKTVNRIKNEVASKFRDYQGRIAFLAIDTDASDLRKYSALSDREKFLIPAQGNINDRHNKPEMRKPFTKKWINPRFMVDLTLDGANQIRQACRAKLFDEGDVAFHNDEQIIHQIRECAQPILASFLSSTMKFRVHIVTGISGGTGSGALVEIAHFVHRAFDEAYHGVLQLYGYFYLPDVVEQYHVGQATMGSIQANGYAALKELDYYQSVTQREDADILELSTHGRPAHFITRHNPLYDMTYLVSGSNGGGVRDKNKNAIDAVAETILNQLGKTENANGAADGENNQFLTQSFLANKQSARVQKINDVVYEQGTGKETKGQCGEDSFGYSAVGVAEADIPEQTIKMYAVSKLMRTISGRKNGVAVPESFHGFRQEALSSGEAKSEIDKILQINPDKVEQRIKSFCTEAMNWRETPVLSRDEVLNHSRDQELRAMLGTGVAQDRVQRRINEYFDQELAATRERVQNFLIEYGPSAFVQMYYGFDAAENHYDYCISNVLRDHRGAAVQRISENKTSAALKDFEERVAQPITGAMFYKTRGAQWIGAFRDHEIEHLAQTIAKDHVFGEGHAYRRLYLDKLDELAAEIVEFDRTLRGLYDAYENMGTAFETHDGFVKAAGEESASNVNIIKEETDYAWAKDIVDRHVQSVAFEQVKRDIIESFMRNPSRWTEFDPATPGQSPRREMDRIVADKLRYDEKLSVINYIEYKIANGAQLTPLINGIVKQLQEKAKPLYNVRSEYLESVSSNSKIYMIIPTALIANGETGKAVDISFQEACRAARIDRFYAGNAQSIVCYSLYMALPTYALSNLEVWENSYETVIKRPDAMIHWNESGTGIYDPDTGLAWKDYPALCLRQDPRERTAQGVITREGNFFLNTIDPMFKEAMEKGVIVENVTDDNGVKKYSYSCFRMDQKGWDYTIDFDRFRPDPETGLYPTDERMYRYFAEKNNDSVDKVLSDITLLQMAGFNAPYPDRRIAMERAKRALRRNVPLFLALKTTLKRYDEVTKEIQAENAIVLQGKVGTLVPYYIASGILGPQRQNWTMNDYPTEDHQTVLCKMDPFSMQGNKLFDKGLKFLVIWNAFMEKLSADPQIQNMWRGPFSNLVDDPASYADEFLARLRPFSEEAEDFVKKYDGNVPTNTGARAAFRKEMGIDSEKLDEYVALYQNVIKVYNQILSYKEN